MSQRARSRARGYLPLGALFALLVHVQVLAPIGAAIWFFARRQQSERERARAQEMDVEFKDVTAAELPKDLPPIDPPADELAPPTKLPPPKPKPIAREKKREDKPAPQDKPQDVPEKKVVEAPAKPEPPPPPPEERRGHEKIVDQENDKNEPPPPDAHYLAQNNHHTAEEKRATETTLEKKKHDDKKKNELPTDEKDKIADLEDQKSALGRRAPEVTPHENPQVAETEKNNAPKNLLALRDPAPKTHEISPETADPSLPKAADGDVAMSRPARGAPADPSHVKAGDKVKLALSQKDFEYLFGADADAERRLAEKHRSTRTSRACTAASTSTGGSSSWKRGTRCRARAPSTILSWPRRWRRSSTATAPSTRSRSCARRATWPSTPPPSTCSTRPARSPIRRARSARPTARSTCTGPSTATSGSARPRSRSTSSSPRSRTPRTRARSSTGPNRRTRTAVGPPGTRQTRPPPRPWAKRLGRRERPRPPKRRRRRSRR